MRKRTDERLLSVEFMQGLNVDQMYGIEVEEFPCRVAETALYLIDHVMNMKASEEFGEDFIKGTSVPVAFVSTNSITQGEQVSILWPRLVDRGVRIRFAHRTFSWTNDAPGRAAVHCVIIGWGLTTPKQKEAVRAAAQTLLDTRAAIQTPVKGQKPQTLADLYDADVMPAARGRPAEGTKI